MESGTASENIIIPEEIRENKRRISPNADPVYSQSGWTMPADAMSPEDAEQYGFGIAKGKDGEIIGYYTKGQVAQPFLYPAFKSMEKTAAKEIEEALAREMEKKLK